MALEHLDGGVFESCAANVLESINDFDEYIKKIKERTSYLLETWDGDSSEAFKKDYDEIFLKLKDMRESMYELREDLLSAAAAFALADHEVASGISGEES